ncbi:MAG: hypothetical protein QF792_08670, partial [Phycisphaerae bacterium]|nr:hypothetical protein [Phycisphaerae bacterium]
PNHPKTRPNILGLAIRIVEKMAVLSGNRPATDCYPLASTGISTLLAMEVQQDQARPAKD